jgi:hypothetical protein
MWERFLQYMYLHCTSTQVFEAAITWLTMYPVVRCCVQWIIDVGAKLSWLVLRPVSFAFDFQRGTPFNQPLRHLTRHSG